MKNYKNGMGIIEIIIAMGLFIIIASTGASLVLHGFSSNRLSEEETRARHFAEEGIEAVRSIKTQGWSSPFIGTNCLTGCGLTSTNSKWEFSGANNTLSPFTRVIKVEPVSRDVSGTIVTSGGTDDPDTKKVTSSVTWNFTQGRANSVDLSVYLTNFRKAITTLANAILFYGDTTTNQKTRYYDTASDTFTVESSTVAGEAGRSMTIKTSPTKKEAVAGYVSSGGTLHILCFNGTSWSEDWTQTVGGTGTTQRFDIAYEKTSGDALIVYSTNSAINELGFRTKLGSTNCGAANWSAHTTREAQRTTGIVHWIQLESNPTASSNSIAVLWADANSDLSALQWTGSDFTITESASALETNLERVSTSQDVKSFDMTFESNTGNLMVVWGLSQSAGCTAGTTIATTNCIRYARYTSSWQTVAVIPTVADPATNIDISANPNSNELVLASLDNSQADLSIAYWSGSIWTGRANQDTSTNAAVAGGMYVTTGWLINGTTTRSIVVYVNSSTQSQRIHGFVGNGNVFTRQGNDTTPWFTPSPTLFGNPPRWLFIEMDPLNKDRLMLVLSDLNSDLFAKRLVMTSTPTFTWSNSDGGSALETTLNQAIASPFSFAYWRM